MKQLFHIAALLDKPEELALLVEDMATRRFTAGYGNQLLFAPWQVLETSSTEVYADCTLILAGSGMPISLSFTTPFLFTCVKESEERYKMEWGFSLS